MSSQLATGLLKTAHDLLAGQGSGRPTAARYRRAISTAYYAVFHLLVAEAVTQTISRGVRTHLGQICGRSVMHAHLTKVSKWVQGFPPPRHLQAVLQAHAIPVDLKNVAVAVLQLRDAREEADYDPSAKVTRAAAAFHVTKATALPKKPDVELTCWARSGFLGQPKALLRPRLFWANTPPDASSPRAEALF